MGSNISGVTTILFFQMFNSSWRLSFHERQFSDKGFSDLF